MFDKTIEWIIEKFNGKIDKEDVVWGFVGGLLCGLVGGLLCGLLCGLLWGLVCSLLWGLVCGLGWGLVGGLAGGFGSLISVSAIAFFQDIFIPIWILIVAVVILTEIIFWLDKTKPRRNESKFNFALIIKLKALGISIFSVIEIFWLMNLIEKSIPFIKQHNEVIIKVFGYIGLGIIGLAVLVGILYLWIKLNSMKYNRKKRK